MAKVIYDSLKYRFFCKKVAKVIYDAQAWTSYSMPVQREIEFIPTQQSTSGILQLLISLSERAIMTPYKILVYWEEAVFQLFSSFGGPSSGPRKSYNKHDFQ
jgi:hypothetical protein